MSERANEDDPVEARILEASTVVVGTAGAGTGEPAGQGRWLLLIYRVPPEPTRLRSTVWRRIKSLGAIYLQNSVAALPAGVANGRLTGVFSHHRVTRGDSLGLRLVPEHVHLFPATDAA